MKLIRATLLAVGAELAGLGLTGTAAWIVIAYFFHQNMIDAVTGGREIQRADDPRCNKRLSNGRIRADDEQAGAGSASRAKRFTLRRGDRKLAGTELGHNASR